jgi:hypothetical protein
MANNTFTINGRTRLVDDLTVLKAKGTVATSMVGENPVGTDKTYDAGGHTTGNAVLIVYAVPNILASTKMTFRLQGGLNSSFSTVVDLNIVELGDSTQVTGADKTTGKYIMPFSTNFDGASYRYLRHYLTIGGTCGTGVQYEYFLTQ